jgi:molecular chaperone GrpE
MTNNDKNYQHEPENGHEPILPKSDDPVLDEKLSELEILRQSLEASKIKAAEYNEQLLRHRADFDNYRKRMEKEKAEFVKYSNEGLMGKFLALFDDMERAKKAIEDPDSDNLKPLISGVNLIYKNFHNFLKQEGVKEIKALGEILDPSLHMAVAQVESDKGKDNEIVEELQKGYTMNGRVIRPAMVKVSRRKYKEEVKQEEAPPEENSKQGNEEE